RPEPPARLVQPGPLVRLEQTALPARLAHSMPEPPPVRTASRSEPRRDSPTDLLTGPRPSPTASPTGRLVRPARPARPARLKAAVRPAQPARLMRPEPPLPARPEPSEQPAQPVPAPPALPKPPAPTARLVPIAPLGPPKLPALRKRTVPT